MAQKAKSPRKASTPAEQSAQAEAWINTALHAIGEEGIAAFNVEKLAKRLGVTKGSFYWHFRDRSALIEATMLLWEKKGTDDVIAQLEQIQSAEERLKMLMHSALQNTEHLKIEGILAAAAICKSEGIWGIYQRVDSRRRQYVDSLYQEMGLAPKEAQLWGQLAYSTYLGALLTESTKTLSSAPKKDAQHLKKKMPKK